jgi:hypothetical protein
MRQIDLTFRGLQPASMDGCPGLMLIAGDEGVSINLGEVIEEIGTAS